MPLFIEDWNKAWATKGSIINNTIQALMGKKIEKQPYFTVSHQNDSSRLLKKMLLFVKTSSNQLQFSQIPTADDVRNSNWPTKVTCGFSMQLNGGSKLTRGQQRHKHAHNFYPLSTRKPQWLKIEKLWVSFCWQSSKFTNGSCKILFLC